MSSFAATSSVGPNDSRGSIGERGWVQGGLTFDESLQIEEVKEDEEANAESVLVKRSIDRHSRTVSSGISDKMKDALKSRNSSYFSELEGGGLAGDLGTGVFDAQDTKKLSFAEEHYFSQPAPRQATRPSELLCGRHRRESSGFAIDRNVSERNESEKESAPSARGLEEQKSSLRSEKFLSSLSSLMVTSPKRVLKDNVDDYSSTSQAEQHIPHFTVDLAELRGSLEHVFKDQERERCTVFRTEEEQS